MAVMIGGIDVLGQGLTNEYRVAILEGILDYIIDRNPNLISKDTIEDIKKTALTRLQIKYPHAGITEVK
jgi:hypothetical protein